MAKIAIIGSSFSAALVDWRNKNFDINDYKDYDEYFSNIFKDNNKVLNREDHWINLLSEKYPQHEFHVYASEGAGWEIHQMVLNELALRNEIDRVIVELQNYRITWPILHNELKYKKKNQNIEDIRGMWISQSKWVKEFFKKAYHSKKGNVTYYKIGDHGFPTICGRYHIGRRGVKNTWDDVTQSQIGAIDSTYQMMQNVTNATGLTPKLFLENKDSFDLFLEFINSPMYIIKYKQYLRSLEIIWPKVFDKVGVWAYCYYAIPGEHRRLNQCPIVQFEMTQVEKHIREEPINNTLDTWRNKYYGLDQSHLNKESMPILVDFLLKQPSIQKVLA